MANCKKCIVDNNHFEDNDSGKGDGGGIFVDFTTNI